MKRFLTNTLIRMICLTIAVIWNTIFFIAAIKLFNKLWV